MVGRGAIENGQEPSSLNRNAPRLTSSLVQRRSLKAHIKKLHPPYQAPAAPSFLNPRWRRPFGCVSIPIRYAHSFSLCFSSPTLCQWT
jgi:hypothetical protein